MIFDKNKAITMAVAEVARRVMLEDSEMVKESDEKKMRESHPTHIQHKGRTYYKTGKYGKNMKTGEHSAEYSHHDDKKGLEFRAWRDHSGKVVSDD